MGVTSNDSLFAINWLTRTNPRQMIQILWECAMCSPSTQSEVIQFGYPPPPTVGKNQWTQYTVPKLNKSMKKDKSMKNILAKL